MKTLVSNAEKIINKLKKEGKIEVLDDSKLEDIFDKVDEDMQDYRMANSYKTGISRIEIEKIPPFYDNFE